MFPWQQDFDSPFFFQIGRFSAGLFFFLGGGGGAGGIFRCYPTSRRLRSENKKTRMNRFKV